MVLVHAVENSGEFASAVRQKRRQTAAADGIEDLGRVGRRHRGQRIRKRNPRLEEIDLPVILKLVWGEVLPPDPNIGEGGGVVDALIANVVDREHARRCREWGENAVPGLEENRRKRPRPVVRVDDVWEEARVLACLERRLAEKGETKGVVAVLAGGLVVDSRPPEKSLAVHKPGGDPAIERRPVNPDPLLLAVAHVDAGRALEGEVVLRAINRGIQRENHPHIMAKAAEGLRERGDNIPEPARLRVRGALGGDTEDAEGGRAHGRAFPSLRAHGAGLAGGGSAGREGPSSLIKAPRKSRSAFSFCPCRYSMRSSFWSRTGFPLAS